MGRSKLYSKGDRSQTLLCECGWSYYVSTDSDRAKKIMSLHGKKCSIMNTYLNNPTIISAAKTDINISNKIVKYKGADYINGTPNRTQIAEMLNLQN